MKRATCARCAEVAKRAKHVRIEQSALEALADELSAEPSDPPTHDPARHHLGNTASTLAFVISLDAINFGSGWFPELDKRPGLSGYRTIATGLKDNKFGIPISRARAAARLRPTHQPRFPE